MVEKLLPPPNLKVLIDAFEELASRGYSMGEFKQALSMMSWYRSSVQKNWFGVE